MKTPAAIVYSGYPGAGKTKAAEYGVDHLGGEHVSMGDSVKEIALDALGPEATSHEIGHWATVSREINGRAVMAERIRDRWETHDRPEAPVHIEGVRALEEVAVFGDYLGEIEVFLIDAPLETRLERIQNRGRDGETFFDRRDLIERDQRESEWGLKALAEAEISYTIPNKDSPEALKRLVGAILTNQ